MEGMRDVTSGILIREWIEGKDGRFDEYILCESAIKK